MDFGRLSSIRHVNFKLPPQDSAAEQRSLSLLKRSTPLHPARVGVGCPVWGQKDWVGKVYPTHAQPEEFLPLYAQQFNHLELNITHYRIPTPEAVLEWRAQTPPGFRFCPKWPQEISHHRQLQQSEILTHQFCDSLSRLGDRLGTSFLQLPPTFHPGQLPILRDFLDSVPRGFPICVEFRHPAWFTQHGILPGAVQLLESVDAGTVITDVAGRRDVLHQSLTAPRVLIRFVGNRLDPSDYARIDAWVPRLKRWLEAGLRELEFTVHQPGEAVEPELISYFIEQMNKHAGLHLQDWARKDCGTQLSLL